MPVGTPGRRTYIRVYDEFERLPQFVIVRSQFYARMRYVGISGFNDTARRI